MDFGNFVCRDCGSSTPDRATHDQHLNSCTADSARLSRLREESEDDRLQTQAVELHQRLPGYLYEDDNMMDFCRAIVDMINDRKGE
jgi:hypothetical protein